jgi:hypothetical protein
MNKVLIALAAAATIAVSTMAAPTPADARNRGGAVAAGVIGGLAAGAIIGGAVANSYPRYQPAPGYVVYDGYNAAYPVGCPGGYWARRPVAFDQWGNPVRWSRARFVCP